MTFAATIAVTNFFLVLAGIAAVIYPVLYMRSPWYESTVGRDNMTFAVCIVVIIALLLAVRVFGLEGPPRAALALVIYASLAFLFWRRVWVLWRIQRDPWQFARRDEERRQRRVQRRNDQQTRRQRNPLDPED